MGSRILRFTLFSTSAVGLIAVSAMAAEGGLASLAGTWKSENQQYVLMLGADGSATLNGDFGPISTERIKWTNCSANGTALTCEWAGTYADEVKDITRHGQVAATLEGNTLKGTLKVEKVDKEEWHGSPRYESRAIKDLPFSLTKS